MKDQQKLLDWLNKEKTKDNVEIENTKKKFAAEMLQMKKDELFKSKKETIWTRVKRLIWGI
jgi:hypothetical protein